MKLRTKTCGAALAGLALAGLNGGCGVTLPDAPPWVAHPAGPTAVRHLSLPFAPGEELIYQSRLLGLNAGAARLRFLPGLDPDTVAIELTAATTTAASLLFSFQEAARVECGAADLRPRFARVRARIGPKDQDLSFAFDDAGGTVLVRHGDAEGTSVATYRSAQAWDPLSLIMRLRGQDLSPPCRRSHDVVLGRTLYRVELETIGVEDVATPAGQFTGTHHVRGEVFTIADDGAPGGRVGDPFEIWFATTGSRPVVRLARPTPLGRAVFLLAGWDAVTRR